VPGPGSSPSACPVCGAPIGPGADGCWSCHARFDRPSPGDRPIAPSPPPIAAIGGPYQPPATHPPPAGSIRIGTAMLLIALIAVILGAFAANPVFASVLLLASIPAAIRAFFVTEGRTKGADGFGRAFLLAYVGVITIVVSSAIAFAVTCFRVTYPDISPEKDDGRIFVGYITGAIAAVVAGAFVTYSLLKLGRDRASRRRKEEVR